MAKQFIPIFKKSGAGLGNDLMMLKKIEALSSGWLKGQYMYYMPMLAGYEYVDGIKCYGKHIYINNSTNLQDMSEYSKNVRSFLKLLGMGDDEFNKIFTTYASGQVDMIRLDWKNKIRFESIDFEFVYEKIKKNIDNVKKIELIHSLANYTTNIENRPAKTCSSMFYMYGTSPIFDIDYEGNISEISKIGSMFNSIELYYYDENDTDISDDIDDDLKLAISTALFLTGSTFLEFESLEKLEEIPVKIDEQIISYNVKCKETYNVVFDINFLNSLSLFKPFDETNASNMISYGYWAYGDDFGESNETKLFYKKKDVFDTLYNKKNKLMNMTVEGLARANPNELVYYSSRYANIYVQARDVGGGFLGIGGFLGNFLSGFIQTIIGVVGAVAQIGYFIPEIRLMVQAIAFLLSGDWSGSRERFNVISTKILVAIIAVLITIYSGGSAINVSMSILASAYGIYVALDEFDEMQKKASESSYDELQKDIQSKMLGLNGENENYDYLYEPYKKIDNMLASPFSNDIYNINMGLKI